MTTMQEHMPVIESILFTATKRIKFLTGLDIEIEVKKPLENILSVDDRINNLIIKCCTQWNVDVQFLKQKSKKDNRPIMRFILFYLLDKQFPKLGPVAISRLFGFDHTTVIHGIQKFNDLLQVKDSLLLSYYEPILTILENEIEGNK